MHSNIIPGWATDNRLWQNALPSQSTLIGFSMGALIATEIAQKNPEKIKKLILISPRPSYSKKELDAIRPHLKKNKSAYLKQFYKACFSNPKEYQQFQLTLENDYLENFSLETLLNGLNYLEKTTWNPQNIPSTISWYVIHGIHDTIAPYTDVVACLKSYPNHLITLQNSGHIPFYSKEFEHALSLLS
jgi:pimeloyl-ACP methyl ester carboxylesterase